MDFKDLQGKKTVPEAFMEQLWDYEAMKPHLIMEMMGKEDNTGKLQGIPHKDLEDMAVTYRFLLNRTDEGQATIQLTNSLFESYGITAEQLHQDAVDNCQRIAPVSILNMNEVLCEMSGGLFGGADDSLSPLYIATNASKMRGASVIAYPNFMDQAAEKLGGGFFVLPSSVHEVILIPDSFEMTAVELKQMVTQINASEVAPEERLTDNVYHFDAEAGVFEKAEKFEQRMEKESERKSVLDELGSKKQECLGKPQKEHGIAKRETGAR